MGSSCSLVWVAALASGLGGAAFAKDEDRAIAAGVGEAIESCVDASVIRFRAEDRRAVLQDADAAAVSAAIVRRYPMVEQDGLAPKSLLLWKQPRVGWVYTAMLVNPEKGGELCFTASFSAARFEMTAQLLKKYFNVDAPDE